MHHSPHHIRLVGYLRKSTDDSKHQKASIDDQRKWLDEYITTLRSRGDSVEVVEVFEERMSAKEPGRPEFAKMMKLFYNGKADTIATWDIDRLSRNEVDEGTIKWAIRQGKITQVHTHNTIYTEHELLMMGIFLSLGAEEIAKMRQRVMRRMSAMIGEGKVPYKAPYGYKNHEGGVIPDEHEKDVLRSMFQRRADGYSYKQIAEWLNEQSIHTRSGGKWKLNTVEQIISNKFYIGIVSFAGQVGQGIFERIVSRDLWESVNVEKRANIGWKKHGFALKGIVVSAITWKPLKASLVKKKYVYYHDDTHGISISERDIFAKMEEMVTLWKIPDNVVSLLEESLRSHVKNQNNAVFAEREKSERKLKDIHEKKRRLVNLYTDAKIDDDTYSEKVKEFAMLERKYMDEVESFAGFNDAIPEEFNELVKLVRDLPTAYKTGDDTLKGAILKWALVKLEIDEQKRLVGHEKEPFTWLSSCNVSLWQP